MASRSLGGIGIGGKTLFFSNVSTSRKKIKKALWRRVVKSTYGVDSLKDLKKQKTKNKIERKVITKNKIAHMFSPWKVITKKYDFFGKTLVLN